MNEKPKVERPVGMPEAEAVDLGSLVAYQEGAIVSRTLAKRSGGTVTLFAFEAGQALSEHTTPFDAIVQVLDGGAHQWLGGPIAYRFASGGTLAGAGAYQRVPGAAPGSLAPAGLALPAPACACAAPANRIAGGHALRPGDIAGPAAFLGVKRHGLRVRGEFDRLEWELPRSDRHAGRYRQCRREPRVIERRPARPFGRIDEDELRALSGDAAVRESLIRKPCGSDGPANDKRRHARCEKLLGPSVVGGSDCRRRVSRAVLRNNSDHGTDADQENQKRPNRQSSGAG
jgi:hypothetical protein